MTFFLTVYPQKQIEVSLRFSSLVFTAVGRSEFQSQLQGLLGVQYLCYYQITYLTAGCESQVDTDTKWDHGKGQDVRYSIPCSNLWRLLSALFLPNLEHLPLPQECEGSVVGIKYLIPLTDLLPRISWYRAEVAMCLCTLIAFPAPGFTSKKLEAIFFILKECTPTWPSPI